MYGVVGGGRRACTAVGLCRAGVGGCRVRGWRGSVGCSCASIVFTSVCSQKPFTITPQHLELTPRHVHPRVTHHRSIDQRIGSSARVSIIVSWVVLSVICAIPPLVCGASMAYECVAEAAGDSTVDELDTDGVFNIDLAAQITVKSMEGKAKMHMLGPVKMVDGTSFIQLKKCDRRLERLLTCAWERGDSRRPLAHTDIIEQLTELKDTAFFIACGFDTSDATQQYHRYTGKVLKAKILALNDVVTIEAPVVGNVAGIQIKTLCLKPRAGMWVELSESVLAYLSDVVREQYQHGDIHNRKRAKVDNDHPPPDGHVSEDASPANSHGAGTP